MKTVIGVDTMKNCQKAVDLTTRLNFSNNSVHLVSCVESVLLDGSFPDVSAASPIAETITERKHDAERVLGQLSESLQGQKIDVATKLLFGNPGPSLIEYADSVEADLIAAGGVHEGALESFMFGSVCRALAIGSKQSVLVARGAVDATGPLSAIFATDHSEYADRCVDKLIQMAPKGLEKITVMIATLNRVGVALPFMPMDGLAYSAKEDLEKKNKAICEKLSAAGYECHQWVIEAEPHNAMRAAMKDAEADLMIMGAQGHGFFERLAIGSTSLHVVVSEKYPVLIIRA